MRIAATTVLAGLIALPACDRTPEPIEAPPPETSEDTIPEVGQAPSTLAVPISFDLSPIAQDLEEVVPAVYGDLETRQTLPSNERVEFALVAHRDPFVVSLDRRTARVSTTIHYRARAWYDPPIGPTIGASCGTGDDDPPRRVEVTVASELDLTDDWTLSSRSRVEHVAPASEGDGDRCRITFLQIDMTDRLVDAARDLLREHTDEIDAAVAGLDVRSRFEEWWNVLRTPIELSDSLWLVIDPVAVRRDSVAGDGLTLRADVGLTAHPRIVVGPRPALPPTPLPQLRNGDVGDRLHILMEGLIDYGIASDFIRERLRGREFSGAGETITITDAELSGIGGGRLSLRVDFTGTVGGTIYFVGTPRFDPATRHVHVPDLDFDLASRNLVLSGLAWLARGQAIRSLRERARFPIGDPLRMGYEYLAEGLNRNLSDDVRLSGEVLSIAPLDVYATPRVLRVRAIAEAAARLTIREPDSVRTAGSER